MNPSVIFFFISLFSVFYLIIIPSLCDDWTASCPWNCTCKWTNGKKSAICNSLELKQVPIDLSTELQVLVLNENSISYLRREEFTSLGLINLQRIYLKKSKIQHVDKDTFRDLKILVEIDLSENEIEKIEKDTFYGNERLRILYLNGNPLKELVADQFPKLPHLRSLDFHGCHIETIHSTSFKNLELLELLNIKHNLLGYLDGSTFSHMHNLKTLILDENPWNCDCRLREFRNWYIKSNLSKISLTCSQPYTFKDQPWQNIGEDQFGCMPTIEMYKNANQTDDVGSNVTYSCLIGGDPRPEIVWILNGKILDNENAVVDVKEIENNQIWSNATIVNVTSLDAGVYTCTARNIVGYASQNVSLILDEVVEHVIVEPPKTFLFFRLIIAAFCIIFAIISITVSACLCQKTIRHRHTRKNIKGSVSFNDQEKKLLDLSITTNERQDSCEMVNTPSTNKTTESVIALEPVQITIENISRNDEFPLNVGVFPPPPEFCGSNVISNPAYGNIFISVSLTQDGLDNPDLNMYPDLLNIPNRVKGKFLPVNISSFATLPRNNRPSTSKTTESINNYINDASSIVNYQNLETNFINGGLNNSGAMLPPPQPQTSSSTQTSNGGTSTGGGGVSSGIALGMNMGCTGNVSGNSGISSVSTGVGLEYNKLKMCSACLKNQNQNTYVKGEDFMKCERHFPCPKYDNMGRRVTAGGNSILSLSEEEQHENEILYTNTIHDTIKEVPTPPNGSDFVSL